MGAANLRPFRMNGSMLVRRIVRVGPKFICGICRTHHKEPSTANDCLFSCWHEVKSTSPVIPVRRINNLINYACIYCLRSYDAPHHAASCAADCVKNMRLTFYDGAIPSGWSLKKNWQPNPTPAPLKKAKVPAARPIATIVPTPTPVVAPPPVSAKSEPPKATPTAPEPAAAAAPAAPAVEVKRKNGRTKKFERYGAKYVCEVCQQKYFTKSEVENCFEGHPD